MRAHGADYRALAENIASGQRTAQEVVRGQASGASMAKLALLAWPGLLRKLDRHLPGYEA